MVKFLSRMAGPFQLNWGYGGVIPKINVGEQKQRGFRIFGLILASLFSGFRSFRVSGSEQSEY